MKRKDNTITVLTVDDQKVVNKGKLEAHWGETVEIRLEDEGDFIVFFPRAKDVLKKKDYLHSPQDGTVRLEISERNDATGVKKDSSDGKIHCPYAIYCTESNQIAETGIRGSAPIIIINGSTT